MLLNKDYKEFIQSSLALKKSLELNGYDRFNTKQNLILIHMLNNMKSYAKDECDELLLEKFMNCVKTTDPSIRKCLSNL